MTVTQSDVDALLAAAADQVPGSDVGPSASGGPDDIATPPNSSPNSAAGSTLNGGLSRIFDLSVPIMVKLAEQSMPLSRVLAVAVGGIIEFDRRFDSELELVVSNKIIGKGQPIKVGENFGLRITRIGDLDERIRALGGA